MPLPYRARAALALTLVAAGRLATAQPAPQAPVFQTDVSLVLLPVFVIDKDGRAVRGLQPADFEVEEDGRRAEVVSFRYVDTTEAAEADEPLASAARRRFLLLFDKSFTDLAGLTRAQRAARELVRQRLATSDLAAVATFDVNKGVRLVANFTEDRALLAHAISTLGVPSLTRISDPLALAGDLNVTEIRMAPGDAEEATPQEMVDDVMQALVTQMRSAEQQAYQQHIEKLLGSLGTLAGALRRVEGRKQVLYFSAGFDGRLLAGQWGSEQRTSANAVVTGRLWEVDTQSRFGDSNLRDALGEVTRDLAAADTVVHSIDVTGLGSDRSLQETSARQDLVRDTTNRESLSFLAMETGGRLFKDANDLGRPLAEMLEMTSRYYVLGIQPDHVRGPDAYHRLKVKVARKAVKLSNRPGYFERSAAPARAGALARQFDLAELVLSERDRGDLPFTSLCLPFPEPGERQTLGLVVQIPRDSLPWASGEPLSVEVYGYAVAEDGAARDHLAQLVRVEPAHADSQGALSGISLFGTFAVPPGRYTVRLMVREATSGRSAVRLLDVTVPAYDGDAAFSLPPLVLDDSRRWLSLEMGAGRVRAASATQPFRLENQPFVPRTSFEVRPGTRERLVLIVWDPELAGDPAADVEIRSSLTASDGRAVEPGRLQVERVHADGEGRRTFVFAYTPDAVPPGDYTLRIGLDEGGSLSEAYALLRIRPVS